LNGWVAGRATHSALQRMTDLGLMDRSKVKFDKTGKVKSAVGALVDSQLFIKDPQAWVDKYLIPTMKAKGIDVTDAAQVNEFNAQIASNANANAILTNRVLDSQNIAKDRRNVMKANGVDQSDEQNKNSTAGKIENARKRLDDAEERMGAVLLPTFASALEKVASALEWVNKLADESPTAFKALTYGIIGVTTAVAGLTAVSLTSKLAIEPLAGILNAVGAAAPGAVGGLSKLLGIATAAAGVAGTVVAIANTTTNEEDDELKNGKARWATIRAKYPQSVIDAARKKYQPWYQVGSGYAAENEEWLKQYTSENQLPAVPPKATAQSAAPTTDARQYSFTINQAPGQDSKALADEIERRLGVKYDVKRRSSMFDGVN
ncbi:hypothetical protein RSW49_22810, partial [Escherichia coli]|nr:hypothetical protein [Escherichia coli]